LKRIFVVSCTPVLVSSIFLVISGNLAFNTTDGAWATEASLGRAVAQSNAGAVKAPASASGSMASASPAQLNLQQLPNLLDIPQTTESLEKVQKLEQEGEQYLNQKLLDRALSKWQEAYGLSIEMKYAEGEGRALTNMCRVFLERGQMVKAKYMGENAVEVLTNVNDHKALGRAHLNLAQAYFGLDNPVWAGQQLDSALREFNADGTNNSADTARLMNLAASVLIRIGKLKESLQFYQAAATYYGQAGDPVRAVNTYVHVTDILLGLGLLTAASEQCEKALSVARACPDQPGLMVSALTSEANCKYNLAEFPQAKKIYDQIYQIIRSMSNKTLSLLGQANIDIGYGSALAVLGDYEQARQVLEKTLATYKTNGSSLPQAQSANALGVVEEVLGHHEKARLYLEQALDLQNLITPKRDNFRLLLLQDLAIVDSRSGKNRDAKARLDAAIALAKKLKENATLGRLYTVQAEVLLRLADEPEAEKILKEAIAVSEPVNDDAALWRQYALLAKIQENQGNVAAARDSLQSALSFFRSPQADVLQQPENLQSVSSRADLAERLVAALASQKMTEQALLAAEQFKQEAFINEWTNHGGVLKADDQDIYSELSVQREHLHAAEIASPPKDILKDWQAWLGRCRTVSQQNRTLARLIAPIPVTATEIVKGVQRAHATVVEYLVGADTTVVFTLNGAGRISATVVPVGRKKLETQVSALLSAVPRGGAESPQATLTEKHLLQALYGELLPQAVRSFLPSEPEQTILFIPDGPLFNVPYAALISEQSKYLVEYHSIAITSSMDILLDAPARYTDEFSLLVATASSANTDGEEAKAVASAFPSEAVTSLIGKEADLKAIPDQIRGKSIMHIAGSVNFNVEHDPLKSTIPLLDGGKPALAEKLSAFSIPTDTSVWSDTSVSAKDLQGNALRLFSRALAYAGVRGIVMSLWNAPPEARMSELLDFYRNRQSGLGPAQSLRKAQLDALSKDSAPHTWAAYELVGAGL